MLIPVDFETAEAFIARAAEVVDRQDAHLYVDTSFAMWLTAIGPSSRAAFVDWASTLGDRLHVPAWTVQEFYRHHREKTQVAGIEKKCAAVEEALGKFIQHIGAYADGSLREGQPEATYVRELEDLKARVGRTLGAAKSWNYETAATEVIRWMNGRALERTQAFASFAELKRRGEVRYGHEVPPGFEDGHKRANRYGDLLFWEDVMDDAHGRQAAHVVVLTRDRKKDWFFSKPEAVVGPALRRLRGRWNPVPVPHPMLSFELLARTEAELLILDELYLGAVLWSRDRLRFGRFAAVTFGMTLDRLAAETAPPPSVAVRAGARSAADQVSLADAMRLIAAAKATTPTEAVAGLLTGLEGDAPAVEQFMENLTPDTVGAIEPVTLASFVRQLHDQALEGPSLAGRLAAHLLDLVDKVDAARASAIVGGILASAYYSANVPRNRPTGPLLQDAFEWQADVGVARTLFVLGRDLRRARSPALYLPGAAADLISVRIETSTSNAAVPAAVGQVYVGPQAVLTENVSAPELRLSSVLDGAMETTVADLVASLGRHFGLPIGLLAPAGASADEPRTVLDTIGLVVFDPVELPLRQGEVQPEPRPLEAGPDEDPGEIQDADGEPNAQEQEVDEEDTEFEEDEDLG